MQPDTLLIAENIIASDRLGVAAAMLQGVLLVGLAVAVLALACLAYDACVRRRSRR